jgi:hypothetical protein
MTASEHTTHTCTGISSSFLEEGWHASCKCGWEGTTQDTMGSAHTDFESHKSWANESLYGWAVEVDDDKP